MCQQTQSVTLQTAVLMQVKEFANNNQSFSVHDITVAIRNKVAQGELEIPEVEVSGAQFQYDIRHDKVKELFVEMYDTGVFDPEFTLSRQFVNKMYFEYTPTLVAGASVAPAPVNVVTPTTTAVSQPSTQVSPNDISIISRVKVYLLNCVKRNFRPTLKQIQSAIKRDTTTGVSCEELKTTVQGLGYTVVDDPEAVSRAQVATV